MNLNIRNIGIWGYWYYDCLKKSSSNRLMRMSGTLEEYLKQVNEHATGILDAFIRLNVKDEGVTGTLKAYDSFEWVWRMNNIRSRAIEFICYGLVHN